MQDEDIQLALQTVVNSRAVSDAVKDRFSDLLALAEDDPSVTPAGAPSGMAVALDASSVQSPLNGGDNSLVSTERKSPAGTSALGGGGGVSIRTTLTNKGGHRLRNLDSRRAAEVVTCVCI